jgi:hypothetical protein
VLIRLAGDGLGAVDDAFGNALLISPVLVGPIVVTADVECGEELVELLPGPVAVTTVDAGRHGSCGIDAANVVGEPARNVWAFRSPALDRLVADAPHDHARMVAIAQEHALEVAFPPVVEGDVVIGDVLAVSPAVERLVDDEHSDPVACVEERRSRRVVRTPNGVEAVRLQQLNLSLLGAIV